MKKLLYLIMFIVILSISNCFAVDFYEITRSTTGNATLSDIRDLVRDRVDDPSTSYGDVRYSNTFLNSLINTAQEDIVINAKCLWSTCTGYTVADQANYELLDDIWAIDRVVWNDDYVLSPKDIYEMDSENAGWFDVSSSSSTDYYWYRGDNNIYLYPPPEYSDGVLQIWYMKRPEDMANDTDEIFDSVSKLNTYKEALVQYAVYRIFFLEGDPRYQIAWQEYTAYIDIIKNTWDIQPNYKPNMKLWRD